MKRILQSLMVVALSLATLVPLHQSYAKGSSGGRSGGGFSSRPSSSGGGFSSKPSAPSGGGFSSKPSAPSGGGFSSKPSTPAPSGGGFSSKPSTPPSSSSWFSSKPSTPAPAASGGNKALNNYNKNSTITPPKSRDSYVSDFKAQNAAKYPTTFATPPAVRPSYIPAAVGGNTIIYNSTHGGYGYMDTLGHWVMFDALTHMANHSYGGYVNSYPTTTVVHTGGSTFGTIFIWVLILGVLSIVVIRFIISN